MSGRPGEGATSDNLLQTIWVLLLDGGMIFKLEGCAERVASMDTQNGAEASR
jgi:hypothetical protein